RVHTRKPKRQRRPSAMKSIFVKPVAAVAAGFALVGIAASSSFAASRPVTVPVAAAYAGDLAFTGPASAQFDGAGLGTVVGLSKVHGEISILGPAATCQYGGFILDHTDTITASNGGQVVLAVQDTACQTAATSNIYNCDGTWTIADGNGQFDDSTGRGRFTGQVNFNTGKFQALYT